MKCERHFPNYFLKKENICYLYCMDYSNIEENIKASRASDLLYAKWYATQSNERKSNMILKNNKNEKYTF